MKGMNDLMRQAQIMQKKITKVQEEMANRTVESQSGGGMVSVVMTGAQGGMSVRIDPKVVDPADVDMLQDLVLAAMNEAVKESKAMVEQEMKALTGGMSIPGLF